MRQAVYVPQDHRMGVGKSTGRCSDQQRSRGVKLFHYERTRVAFMHRLLLLSWDGLRGNEEGYLTLEKMADHKPSTICLITSGATIPKKRTVVSEEYQKFIDDLSPR